MVETVETGETCALLTSAEVVAAAVPSVPSPTAETEKTSAIAIKRAVHLMQFLFINKSILYEKLVRSRLAIG